MLFTLTLIRLNAVTMAFENTEFHSFLLLGDLEKELANHNTDFADVEKVLDMDKGSIITIQTQSTEKIWFYYISRVS